MALALRPVDVLLVGYLGVVSVVAGARLDRIPECWWLLLAHALFVLLLFLLTRPDLGPFGRAIREVYPLLLLLGLYGELDVLNGSAAVVVHDPLVQRWELAVFGMQVSAEWWQRMPSRFWSTVLHAAYFAYYVIVITPAFFFAFRRDLASLRHFILVLMTTFVICYLVFIFFPVAGPYYEFPRPAAWFTDNFFARLVYQTLDTGSSYGAAFPSSHVAATVATAISSAQGSRRLGLALVIPTILLTVGVVYCQMHYGIDALTGLVIGIAVPFALRHYHAPED